MKLIPSYKFLNQIEVSGLNKVFEKNNQETTITQLKEFQAKNENNFYAVIRVQDEVTFCSKLEINGKDLWIPEPNPVHIYFYEAFRIVPNLEKSKDAFERLADQTNGYPVGEYYLDLVRFFSEASRYFFFAFSALEAFINQSIPEAIEYNSKKKGKIKKEKIERWITFGEKSTRLMKFIFEKSIEQEKNQVFKEIQNLKEVRDNLIHLKTQNDKYRNKYREVLNKLLNFDYTSSINAVEQYINFYKTAFIEHEKRV